VAGQPADLGFVQHDFTLTAPLVQAPHDEWAGWARVREQVFDTRAVLPDTGDRFPDELWNVRLGTTYRHRFENGWIGGGRLAAGSPGDRPFAGLDEIEWFATATLRVPRGERDAWLFFLDYSNAREFLDGLPLPGLGYAYEPSEAFSAILATGFASLEYRPTEALSVMASWVAIRTVDVRVSYQLFRPVRLWAGFDWTRERYIRADRAEEDDRLFYYEKRVRAGVTVGLARFLYVDVAGGYSFDRFYFEGEDYGDRRDNRLDVGSGPFAAVRVGLRF
jgi:hypothetical protein